MESGNNKSIKAEDRTFGENGNIATTSKNIMADKCKSSENGDSKSIVDKPHAHDILLARGKGVNKHIGNVFLRQLAMQRKQHHKEATHPNQRLIVAYEIFVEINKLDPPGRFLMQTPYDCSKWYDVSDTNAVGEICNLLFELSNEEGPSTQKAEAAISESTPQKYVEQDDASIHSHNTQNTASSNISRLIAKASMMDQSQLKMLNDLKKNQQMLNLENNGTGNGEDKATLELIQRYHTFLNNKNAMETNGIKPSIDNNLLHQLAQRSDYNLVDNRQILSNQMTKMQDQNMRVNLETSNAHLVNPILDNIRKAEHITGQGKPDEKNQQSSQNSTVLKQDSDKKKSLSKRSKVSLPKIDNDELSVNSNQHSVYSTQQSVYSNQQSVYSTQSRRKGLIKSKQEVKNSSSDDLSKASKKSKNKKRQQEDSSDSSTKGNKSAKKQSDQRHQQVIMPLSYIGHSFMNSPDCSSESKSVFEEIAFLGQRSNENALLYLPSIIGSLCKRVMELEENKRNDS